MNHAISRSVITPPTQGRWRCSVVFQQPVRRKFVVTATRKGKPTNFRLKAELRTRKQLNEQSRNRQTVLAT